MDSKDNDRNRQVKELKELLKRTQALPQMQEVSEEEIEAEVEEVRKQ